MQEKIIMVRKKSKENGSRSFGPSSRIAGRVCGILRRIDIEEDPPL
jgi:hypothetical protein